MAKLFNKVVLITGASSGIGKEIALKAAKDKCKLIITARSEDKLKKVKEEAEKLGSKTRIISADLLKTEEIKKLFDEIQENYSQLDVVYNNAGLGFVDYIWNLNEDQISKIIDLNLKSMIYVSKYSAEMMKEQRSGHILITSSVASFISLPKWGTYAATKAGATAFAEGLRHELDDYNVKITTIHPGVIKTNFYEKAGVKTDSLATKPISAKSVADAGYKAALTNKNQVMIPASTKFVNILTRLFPGLSRKLISGMEE